MPSEWYYAQDGKKYGPVTPKQLRGMAEKGQLRPTDLVWREGMLDWRTAGTVKGLIRDQSSQMQRGAPVTAPALIERTGIIILSLFCCFPIGLYFVWRNRRWSSFDKCLWTFLLAASFVGLAILGFLQEQAVREDLARANRLWNEGQEAGAVSIYRDVIDNHLYITPDAERHLMFGRVIDFDAEAGHVESAKKLLRKAQRNEIVPSIESPAARELLANLPMPAETSQGSLTSNSEGSQKAEKESYLVPAEGTVRRYIRESFVPKRPGDRGTLLSSEDLTYTAIDDGYKVLAEDQVMDFRGAPLYRTSYEYTVLRRRSGAYIELGKRTKGKTHWKRIWRIGAQPGDEWEDGEATVRFVRYKKIKTILPDGSKMAKYPVVEFVHDFSDARGEKLGIIRYILEPNGWTYRITNFTVTDGVETVLWQQRLIQSGRPGD